MTDTTQTVDMSIVMSRFDSLSNLLHEIKIDSASSTATVTTRLDYMEKQLAKIDSLSQMLGGHDTAIQLLREGLSTVQKQDTDQEARVRENAAKVGSLLQDYENHVDETKPIIKDFRDLQKLVYIGLGIVGILEPILVGLALSILQRQLLP